MADLTGKDIGRYHIVEHLGQGGMASVYKAFDTRLEREVAIKFIRKEAISEEAIALMLKRFEREAKALARLSHPNIVKVHDYGEFDGSPYLVMEYIKGGTLREKKAGTPMPWEEAARLLAPVARALNYAHQNQIVHRDIKPSNILLTDSGDPMLSDFGIAKILDVQEHTQLTSTGTGVGTPDYMAPEQWMGKVVPQTDIYALGIVFYELVTGTLPFRADTPAAVLIKHMSDPLPRPRSFNPDLPEAVEWVLYKALAKKPEERYADMGAFAGALEKMSQGRLELPETERPAGVAAMEAASAGQTSTQTASQALLQPTPSAVILPSSGQYTPPDSAQAATETAPPAAQTATIAAVVQAAVQHQERPPAARKKSRIWIPLAVLGGLGLIGLVVVAAVLLIFKPFSSSPTQQAAQPRQTQEQEEAQVAETPEQQEEIQPVETQQQEVVNDFKACMAFYGPRDDAAWNTTAWDGMQQAREDYGISIDYAEAYSEDELTPKINALVDGGCSMVLAASYQFSAVIEEAARTYPDVSFVVLDGGVETENPNQAYVYYQIDQAGFLMGALAGMMTWSESVFAVCGPDTIPPVWRYCEGYRAGAQYINPDIVVETIYYTGELSTAFVDETWGADIATAYYQKGFDVMFVAAGQTGVGALRGFALADNESHPVYGLGVDYDYYDSVETIHSILLSSAVKRIDQAAYTIIGLTIRDRFPAGRFMGQIGYAPFHDLDIRVPDSVQERMEEIQEDLENGNLQTGVPEAKP